MKRTLFLLCFLPAWLAAAELRLASVFQDHAVLQRGRPVPVWGEAPPGREVTIAFLGRTVTARTDAAGRWRIDLPALEATLAGSELLVRCDDAALRLADVVVGEVWLCSGQSNMEWNVARAARAEQEMAAADFPLIRVLKVGVASVFPAVREIARGTWKVCRPDTVGGFTAVGYHFARELQADLGVPVGIIDCTWGGTTIEAWLDDRTLLLEPNLGFVFERWGRQTARLPARFSAAQKKLADWESADAAARAQGGKHPVSRPVDFWSLEDRERPMGLYGGMVAPLVPYGIAGVAWYQGENNARRASEYPALLAGLINGWRARWEREELPFLVVQLPNYAAGNPAGDTWARFREAQARVVRRTPRTGLVVTIDAGDPTTVHPLEKREVGRRLALLARAQVYDRAIEAQGPVFRELASVPGALRVHFDHAAGLHGAEASLPGFEIAGSDGRYVSAQAGVAGADAVTVSAAAVPVPVSVRYAWSNAPTTGLTNSAGLPAVPFCSDAGLLVEGVIPPEAER
jgi:sialate O-acetylesterase